MSFLYLEAFIWFPHSVQNEVQIPEHSIQDPQWSEFQRPWTFSACPCPIWFLPLGMRFSILPVETCPLRPGANTISMKHFLIHLVVINHLFSWAPIGFNLYFHPTPFGPMFILVNSIIRLASSREWTHNTNKCLNCWIQDMLATSNRKYVMGRPAYETELSERSLEELCLHRASEIRGWEPQQRLSLPSFSLFLVEDCLQHSPAFVGFILWSPWTLQIIIPFAL